MSDRPLRFLLAVHNHQPVGNFESVFAQGFEDCYRPFLRAVLRRPSFRFAAHYSGPLLEYMKLRERESWEILAELVGRGQVELLGGGFYEPVLSVIPERDRLGQLRMMGDYLAEHFRVRPRGIWLTERVWEPTLPETLARAGVEFTLLDEEHFRSAGVADTHASYATEEGGSAVRVFPIDKKLRYLIPFRGLDDLREYLGPIRASGGLAVLGDDGEKFGMWPGTKDWVYGRGWLEDFFRFVEENGVRMTHFGEVLDSDPPAGRVYLPPASYEEMMEWALPAEAAEALVALKKSLPAEAGRFLRGGVFRDFFAKYPESDRLHKRMLLVSGEVAERGGADARAELFRGQGNDPLWHGVFGGLYLPHLREASYGHLLRAEKLLARGTDSGWRIRDYDADGEGEAIILGEAFAAIVAPRKGGGLLEIDHYPLSRNLADVLGRRREAYHVERGPEHTSDGGSIHELAKELPGGARELFRYDAHERLSGLDRIYEPETMIGSLDAVALEDRAAFVRARYEAEVRGARLRLEAAGPAALSRLPLELNLEKTFVLSTDGLEVRIVLRNPGRTGGAFQLGSEWNLYQNPEEFSLGDGAASLCGGRLRWRAEGAKLLAFPVETLSQSERGYDIIHQGYCLLASWRIVLPPGGVFETSVRLESVPAASGGEAH